MWDTLKAQFERNTLANKLLLKRDYFTRKMQEGQQTVQEHLKGMKEITDQLAALDSAVAEDEQVIALLISLPPSYDSLVTALTAKGEDLTLSFVQQSLIREEQKRESEKGTRNVASRDSALQANRQGPKKSFGQPPRFQGKCFNCKKFGHRASECRNGDQGGQKKKWPESGHSAKTVEAKDFIGSDWKVFLVATMQTECRLCKVVLVGSWIQGLHGT